MSSLLFLCLPKLLRCHYGISIVSDMTHNLFAKKIHDRVTNKLVILSKAVGFSTPTVLPTIYFVRGRRQRRVYQVSSESSCHNDLLDGPTVCTYGGHFQKYEMALRTRMTEGPVVL